MDVSINHLNNMQSLYTTTAALFHTAPQLSNTELKVDMNELVSHNTQTLSLKTASDKEANKQQSTRHLTCSLEETDVALEKQELDGKEMPVGQEQSDEWPAVLEVASDDHRNNPINKAYQREYDDGQPLEGDWQSRDKPVRFKTESTSESSHGLTVQTGHAQQYNLHPHLHTVPVLEQSDESPAVMEVADDDPGDTPTHKVDVNNCVNLTVCKHLKAYRRESVDGWPHPDDWQARN